MFAAFSILRRKFLEETQDLIKDALLFFGIVQELLRSHVVLETDVQVRHPRFDIP